MSCYNSTDDANFGENFQDYYCLDYRPWLWQLHGWKKRSCHCRKWNCPLIGGHGERNRRYLHWQRQFEKVDFFHAFVVHLNAFLKSAELTLVVNSIIAATKKSTNAERVIVFPGYKDDHFHLHVGLIGAFKFDFAALAAEIKSSRRILVDRCPRVNVVRGLIEHDGAPKSWLSYCCKTDPSKPHDELPPRGRRYKQVYGLKVPPLKVFT